LLQIFALKVALSFDHANSRSSHRWLPYAVSNSLAARETLRANRDGANAPGEHSLIAELAPV
jgi:hypothetical protein